MNRFWRSFHRQWSVVNGTNRARFFNSSDKSSQQSFPNQASWGSVKRAATFKTILTGIALVGSGGYFTTLAYVKWVSSDENKIKERFNNPITITVDLKHYVPRTDVISYVHITISVMEAQRLIITIVKSLQNYRCHYQCQKEY